VDFAVAILVAVLLNGLVVVLLRSAYPSDLYRPVALAYLGTISLRCGIALFLWLNYQDVGFARLFWGDSGLYDAMGAAVAEAWSHGGTTNTWAIALEGKVNSGFIYFVAAVYYVFGRNTLLVQFLNATLGALTSIVILELGLLIYDQRTALRAMLLTAFFPQVIFWSAALYKDAAVMLCIALNILALLRLKSQIRVRDLVLYVATAAALVWLRFYIFSAIAIATLSGFLVRQGRRPLLALASQFAAVAALLVLLLLTPAGKELMSTTRFFDLQQLQLSRFDLALSARSGFASEADVSTVSGILSVLPAGVANLLLAPFPWRVIGLRQALALPDVLVWYALLPALLYGLVSAVRFRLSQTMPILVFTTTLTLAYGAFLGNAGTAYRQRTQVMIFYFLFIADGLERRRAARLRREDEASALPSGAPLLVPRNP
jgi:Dolichyl-phosphate-mannose-protein mannosyltransferase